MSAKSTARNSRQQGPQARTTRVLPQGLLTVVLNPGGASRCPTRVRPQVAAAPPEDLGGAASRSTCLRRCLEWSRFGWGRLAGGSLSARSACRTGSTLYGCTVRSVRLGRWLPSGAYRPWEFVSHGTTAFFGEAVAGLGELVDAKLIRLAPSSTAAFRFSRHVASAFNRLMEIAFGGLRSCLSPASFSRWSTREGYVGCPLPRIWQPGMRHSASGEAYFSNGWPGQAEGRGSEPRPSVRPMDLGDGSQYRYFRSLTNPRPCQALPSP